MKILLSSSTSSRSVVGSASLANSSKLNILSYLLVLSSSHDLAQSSWILDSGESDHVSYDPWTTKKGYQFLMEPT